jgi:hypothetical protein
MDDLRKDFQKYLSNMDRHCCWVWNGSVGKDGYGIYRCQGINFQAHRSGAILFGKRVISLRTNLYHTCGNKLCCNPRHMRIKDGKEDYDVMGRELMVSYGYY